MHIELIPIKTELKKEPFDLFGTIIQSIERNGEDVREGDIIVVSSKFVAMSQGAIVELNTVHTSEEAQKLAEKFGMDPRLAELVIRESEHIFSGIEGFILVMKDGVMAPNAGIDKSNVQKGYVILYPREPFKVAQMLYNKLHEKIGRRVGVVIVDSRLMPTRMGTVGITLAVAGFEPVEDMRGRKDLFGNELRVTKKATADCIATSANMIMGESDESIPIVIVRNCKVRFNDKSFSWRDLAIPHDQCIYVKGLKDS